MAQGHLQRGLFGVLSSLGKRGRRGGRSPRILDRVAADVAASTFPSSVYCRDASCHVGKDAESLRELQALLLATAILMGSGSIRHCLSPTELATRSSGHDSTTDFIFPGEPAASQGPALF